MSRVNLLFPYHTHSAAAGRVETALCNASIAHGYNCTVYHDPGTQPNTEKISATFKGLLPETDRNRIKAEYDKSLPRINVKTTCVSFWSTSTDKRGKEYHRLSTYINPSQ